MTYTIYGPFNNGSSPGISATFLNALETWAVSVTSAAIDPNITSNGSGLLALLGLQINPTAVSLTGSTSGTAQLYQTDRGTFKRVVIFLNNFQNGGGSAQTIALPTAFASSLVIRTGDINTCSLLVSASAQNIAVLSALSGSGGTQSTQTTIGSYSIGFCNHAIDTVSFGGSAGSAHTGLIIMEGI